VLSAPDEDQTDVEWYEQAKGKTMGVTYGDAEPLRLEEKVAQRDEER
jgi:hypothetical protein